ncbi:hypothetical protein BS17DRAFT_776861 [Gyrodon lividus]|nr:hypothetical protein BS17DRAFT_776861 [Gyrodon lividus]
MELQISMHILKEFPWYDDLYRILNRISNFTAKITTWQPDKSRGVNHLKLIANPGKATPPPNKNNTPGDDVPYKDLQQTEPKGNVNMGWEGSDGDGDKDGGGDEGGDRDREGGWMKMGVRRTSSDVAII